ncbi:MAG: hypothetical protein M1827_006993 [Pycnora praestabilis]|nr:MAG: hypothetical protein M1827_006993 [Pycnora praestabilis]
MSKRRTLDTFFQPSPSAKKPRTTELAAPGEDEQLPPSTHPTYPYPISQLPLSLNLALASSPASDGKEIRDPPDLDLLYFQPYLPKRVEEELFAFLRQELFFYRVEYKIKRGGMETQIRTPRYTTVFGVDETSHFVETGEILDHSSGKSIPKDRYKNCRPRPIPHCLDELRKSTEAATGDHFNFCLVNYYATGADSISYHSDDERFLGPQPSIASFSLGAKRDFLLKHKPIPPVTTPAPPPTAPLKLPLASGDMILMRGPTQSNWLHSVPKRKGGESERGRINITFRKAMVPGGTENYYNYNVGSGGVFRWDGKREEMVPWVKAV